ncbi:MAG: helix-turn-helix domain containing protein [Oscillospiraceae bacterium]|jgi:transposase-like protein|nr:helix-turn-helix domain containing protein [Oscillospiraceae bacterium]
MAHSIDFRKKVIEYKDKGHTHAEVLEVFGIHPTTLADWRKLLEENGSLEPKYPETRSRN